MRAGPWTAWPGVGGADIDPYARAVVARSGEAPLARDQGLVFIGDDGCRTARRSTAPANIASSIRSRRALLDAVARDARTARCIDNPTGRYGFSSVDMLRREGGAFDIVIARNARAGNWLSPGDARKFILLLRLYDTPLDIEARPDPDSFPKIVKLKCA